MLQGEDARATSQVNAVGFVGVGAMFMHTGKMPVPLGKREIQIRLGINVILGLGKATTR